MAFIESAVNALWSLMMAFIFSSPFCSNYLLKMNPLYLLFKIVLFTPFEVLYAHIFILLSTVCVG